MATQAEFNIFKAKETIGNRMFDIEIELANLGTGSRSAADNVKDQLLQNELDLLKGIMGYLTMEEPEEK